MQKALTSTQMYTILLCRYYAGYLSAKRWGELTGNFVPTPRGVEAMNRIFSLQALRELANYGRLRREITGIGLMYGRAGIVVVLSFPAFQYVA